MKWKSKKLYAGESRIIRKFLLFPTCLSGEWRWLEYALIHQYTNKDGKWVDGYWTIQTN
jgi:hypothetical protein